MARKYTAPYLSDETRPTIGLICRKCGRRGRYNVARLIERHGDMPMPTFLTRVAAADCPHMGKMYDPCGVVYEHPIDGRGPATTLAHHILP